MVTDRGDASGTGLLVAAARASTAPTCWSWRSATRSPRHGSPGRPRWSGARPSGAVIGAGTGRQHGRRPRPRPRARRRRWSRSAPAARCSPCRDTPTADPSGYVAGFADATGRYLPLVCTLNAARVLDATAEHARRDARRTEPTRARGGPGSRTASRCCRTSTASARRPCPTPAASVVGLRRGNMTPANIARVGVRGSAVRPRRRASTRSVAQGVEPRASC